MARARNIKPSLFKNELLGADEVDPFVSLLFISLWCLADREGRLEDRPLRIKAETFPYRTMEPSLFNGYLTELERLGFIRRYAVDGKAVILVLNFTKHQSPHNTEKASELPEPPLETIETIAVVEFPVTSRLDNGYLTEQERSDSLLLIPDSGLLNPDTSTTTTKPKRRSTVKAIDEEWLASLEGDRAYVGVDIAKEYSKAKRWAETHSRKCTRKFFLGWLNRVRPDSPKLATARNGNCNDASNDLLSPEYAMPASRVDFCNVADPLLADPETTFEHYETLKANWTKAGKLTGHEKEIEEYEQHSYKFRQRFAEARS